MLASLRRSAKIQQYLKTLTFAANAESGRPTKRKTRSSGCHASSWASFFRGKVATIGTFDADYQKTAASQEKYLTTGKVACYFNSQRYSGFALGVLCKK